MTFLLALFSFCIVLQTIYAVWMLWMGPEHAQKTATTKCNQGISVIICARNEAVNLKQNLEKIIHQNYPLFEVIIVNDASTDDSAVFLEQCAARYPNVKIIPISPEESRTLPGKKFALSKGVSAAQYNHLLLCDADCWPVSNEWASLMCSHFDGPVEIVVGFGAYQKQQGLLNSFIRWETMHSFVQYSTYTRSGLPYMAVGRNMACTKNTLLAAQQHKLWQTMPSGDDDLLIRLMGRKNNVALETRPEAFTYTLAKSTWPAWLTQKQRHLSTGKLYKKSIQVLLGAYGLSHGLMWLLAFILWISGWGYITGQLLLLRCIIYWSIWTVTSSQLKDKKLILFLPIGDVLWAFYNLILSPYIFFKNQQKWK